MFPCFLVLLLQTSTSQRCPTASPLLESGPPSLLFCRRCPPRSSFLFGYLEGLLSRPDAAAERARVLTRLEELKEGMKGAGYDEFGECQEWGEMATRCP